MNNQRSYAGIIFEVWEGERSWYWFVIDPHCDGGAIGVAASETAAVRDACLSIDAMTARIDVVPTTEWDWEISLANLERYLVCVTDAAA